MRAGDSPVRFVPAAILERVVIRAETSLSSQVLSGLADLGVSVVILGGRAGDKVAIMHGAPSNDARSRIAQCQIVTDEVAATHWARGLIRVKIRRQRRLIEHALARRADLRKPLTDAAAAISRAESSLKEATTRAVVRGVEGAAAAAYFKGYALLFAPTLAFEGRRRRPPPDPVNACLSLAYTLLHAEAVQACHGAGLDPMVGLFHLPSHGHATMASDLIEPWRARVDHWVWSMFRDRHLRAEHFTQGRSGAYAIGKAGRSSFYAQWREPRVFLCKALRRQARVTARALADAARVGDSADPGSMSEAVTRAYGVGGAHGEAE